MHRYLTYIIIENWVSVCSANILIYIYFTQLIICSSVNSKNINVYTRIYTLYSIFLILCSHYKPKYLHCLDTLIFTTFLKLGVVKYIVVEGTEIDQNMFYK